MIEDIVHCQWRTEAPLRVELTGISYCDGSYWIRRRNSKLTVFEYIVRGSGTLEIGNRTYRPTTGDVYIVTEGSDHEYRADAWDPWTKIWFNTSGPLPLTLLDTYGLRGVHHIPNLGGEQMFREGYEACYCDPSQAEDVVAVILHKVVMRAAHRLLARREPVARQSQELRDYLDRCVEESPSLADMAAIMARSESQTIRTFSREWGMTPYQYLIGCKLRKARVLLTGTAKAVKEIAAELGFNDQFHFSVLFKQKVGLSPRHYRKALEQGERNRWPI